MSELVTLKSHHGEVKEDERTDSTDELQVLRKPRSRFTHHPLAITNLTPRGASGGSSARCNHGSLLPVKYKMFTFTWGGAETFS